MSAAMMGLLAAGYLALLVSVICVLTVAKRADEAMQRAVDADGMLARRFGRSAFRRRGKGPQVPHRVA